MRVSAEVKRSRRTRLTASGAEGSSNSPTLTLDRWLRATKDLELPMLSSVTPAGEFSVRSPFWLLIQLNMASGREEIKPGRGPWAEGEREEKEQLFCLSREMKITEWEWFTGRQYPLGQVLKVLTAAACSASSPAKCLSSLNTLLICAVSEQQICHQRDAVGSRCQKQLVNRLKWSLL